MRKSPARAGRSNWNCSASNRSPASAIGRWKKVVEEAKGFDAFEDMLDDVVLAHRVEKRKDTLSPAIGRQPAAMPAATARAAAKAPSAAPMQPAVAKPRFVGRQPGVRRDCRPMIESAKPTAGRRRRDASRGCEPTAIRGSGEGRSGREDQRRTAGKASRAAAMFQASR